MNIKRNIAFSLITISLALLLLEGIGRLVEIWMPPKPIDEALGFDPTSKVFVTDSYDRGFRITLPSKIGIFLKQRFLAIKPHRIYRIAALGESSVNFLQPEFIKMAENLHAIFPDKYDKVEIINFGALSYGTQRLLFVLLEIFEYQPDLIILYAGHNEFEEVEQLKLAKLGWLTVNRTIRKSAFVRVISDMAAQYQINQLKKEHDLRMLSKGVDSPRAWQYQFTKKDVDERMKAFRTNLEIMIRLCESKGVPLIIGTIPSNLYRPLLSPEYLAKYSEVQNLISRREFSKAYKRGQEILMESVWRHQSSGLENAIIRELA